LGAIVSRELEILGAGNTAGEITPGLDGHRVVANTMDD